MKHEIHLLFYQRPKITYHLATFQASKGVSFYATLYFYRVVRLNC